MKMKKIVLLFSMIAVFCSLTACSSGKNEVDFDYTSAGIIDATLSQAYQLDNINDAYRAYFENIKEENPMAEVMLTGISNFDSAREECGEFKGYRSKEDGSSISFDFSRLNTQDQDEYNQALVDYNELLSLVDADIEENDDGNVIVTVRAVYEKRDVLYSFVYEANPEAEYSYELSGQDVSPYKVKEITVTPDYTFSEKMAKAGANTLMGMGTVFAVLIFISLIISQFEKIGKASEKIAAWWANRKQKTEEDVTEEAPKPAIQPQAAPVNPMDDAQLVAVITAAIAAASGSAGGSDKLVVRSIRKAKR